MKPSCISCSNTALCGHCNHNTKHVDNFLSFRNSNVEQQSPQEICPSVGQHWYIRITPEKKCSRVPRQVNLCSPSLHTIHEAESTKTTTDGAKLCTPLKNSAQTPCNPFDIEVDSLHFPSLSPSVFSTLRTKESQESKPFRWSIDQIAVLNPVDIDETSQQDTWLDADLEVKAQKAIDTFFEQNHVVPSPWGSSAKAAAKNVTFSPNLASTAYFSKCDKSNASSRVTIGQEKQLQNEVWTQTMLTIPPNVDLMELLGQYYTFQGEQCENDSSDNLSGDTDMLSTSSLRRKLFVNVERDSSPSRQENGKEKMQHSFSLSPRCITPDTKMHNWSTTPASDHFSSSPITPRNCSISINCAGHTMSSPSMSPISKSAARSQHPRYCFPDVRKTKSPMEDRSPSLNRISSMQPNIVTFPAVTGVLIPIIPESNIHDATNHETVSQMESREGSGNLPFSSTCPDSMCSVNRQDTGYQTGSLHSLVSLNSYHTMSNVQSRISPVTEMLDSCIISHQHLTHGDGFTVSAMSLDQSALVSIMNDSAISEMVISQNNVSQDQKLQTSSGFNNLPWKPHVCSTPTKSCVQSSECS